MEFVPAAILNSTRRIEYKRALAMDSIMGPKKIQSMCNRSQLYTIRVVARDNPKSNESAERHARKLWKRGHKRRIQRVLGKKFEQPPAGGKLRTTGLPNYVTDAVVSKDIQHLNLSDKYALAVINGFVPSAGQGRNVVTDYLRPFLTPQMDLVHDDGEVNEMDDDDEFTRAGSRQQALAAGHRHAHFELGRVQN